MENAMHHWIFIQLVLDENRISVVAIAVAAVVAAAAAAGNWNSRKRLNCIKSKV